MGSGKQFMTSIIVTPVRSSFHVRRSCEIIEHRLKTTDMNFDAF